MPAETSPACTAKVPNSSCFVVRRAMETSRADAPAVTAAKEIAPGRGPGTHAGVVDRDLDVDLADLP